MSPKLRTGAEQLEAAEGSQRPAELRAEARPEAREAREEEEEEERCREERHSAAACRQEACSMVGLKCALVCECANAGAPASAGGISG
jgi:hypothetical protein